MSPDRARRVSTTPLVVTLPVVGLALLAVDTGQSASADESAPVEMMLEDLDFIVEDALRLEFVVVGDAPDIAPPTTTTLPPATTSTNVPDDSTVRTGNALIATFRFVSGSALAILPSLPALFATPARSLTP